MALETTDLLVVQRPATKLHYKVTVSDLTGSQLPDGFEDIDAINVVRELADLLYRVEDYQIALEEQVELEDDFPDNVIKFKKDE